MTRSKAIRIAAVALGAAAVTGVIARSRRSEPALDVPVFEPSPPTVMVEPVPTPEPRPAPGWQRRLGIVAIVTGVILLIAAAFFQWVPHHSKNNPATVSTSSSNSSVAVPLEFKDKAGHVIVLDTKVAPATLKKMHAVSQLGSSFVKIPAINFATPLGAVDEVDGQLTPPGIYSVYWVRNLGVSVQNAAHGTVFLVIHSVHGGALVPGNQLINVSQGTSAVPVGATITVDSERYRVTRTDVISRTELPTRADVWGNVPNQLVLITCLEQPDGAEAVSNVVVWAQRV